ncbi:hypothetical protein [Alkaliphilus crotonatoxidans]
MEGNQLSLLAEKIYQDYKAFKNLTDEEKQLVLREMKRLSKKALYHEMQT